LTKTNVLIGGIREPVFYCRARLNNPIERPAVVEFTV